MIVRAVSFLLVLISFPAVAAETVTLALDWSISGVHAGYFVALEKGYYRDAGLDVTISRGFGSGDTIRCRSGWQVAALQTPEPSLRRENEDIPVRIIAMVYQKELDLNICLNPESSRQRISWDVRSDAGLPERPLMFPAFLKVNVVQRDSIKEVVVDAIALFLAYVRTGRCRSRTEYFRGGNQNKCRTARQDCSCDAVCGFWPRPLWQCNYRESKIAGSNRMAARAFVNASLKGIAYALAHLTKL